jgi:hypothetical protein
MPVTAQMLRNIMTEARPIIERQMNDAKTVAGFREIIASNGGDWSALKALIKAHVEDENDDAGDGKRVKKILDKADSSSAYADMLGLAKMNEENFSAGQSYADQKGRGEAKLVETIVKGVQTEIGRKALVTALDIMIDSETGEVIEDEPETATESGTAAQVRSDGFAPFTSPAGTADGVSAKLAAGLADEIARKDHQSVSPSSPDGSAFTESAAGKVSELAQPSPPKQAEPIKAGEGVPPSSPAILSDEEVVPAFMKDKQSREAA